MNQDKLLREHLLGLLKGGSAHMTLEEAIENYPVSKINGIFPNGEYSSWHLLEHIRITQNDILEFITNSKYVYLDWPKDYWPARNKKATQKDWKKTIDSFKKDTKALEKIVSNPKTDLYAKIKWGEGQTILREILVVADHNAYHIGEFAIMRQVMNTWGNNHGE
ncbi:MAG: DinB family protein [Patescibacteria group bacterium]|nr:DinB family protein [Patescibacteria group bacterium]